MNEYSQDRRNAVCPSCSSIAVNTRETIGGYELYCCTACDLRFALDAFDADVDYDKIHERGYYHEERESSPEYSALHYKRDSRRQTFQPFFRRLRPTLDRNRLLDIGCGTGRFVREALNRGWRTLGIDISKKAIEYAKTMGLGDYRCARVQEIKGKYDPFDVITAFEVLEHLTDPKSLLKAIRLNLKQDGIFFCSVPAWEYPMIRKAHRRDWVPPIHVLFFSYSSLRTLLIANGFDIVDIGYTPELFWQPPADLGRRARWEVSRMLGHDGYPHGLWAMAKPTAHNGQPWWMTTRISGPQWC